MKNLSEFFHSFDFVRSRPLANWLQNRPAGTLESVLGIEGEEYVIYLADAREIVDPTANSPVEAVLKLPLPAGRYKVTLYSPASGAYSPAIQVESTGAAEIHLPPFKEDIAIRARSRPPK
jgi:hypothetical protein